MSWSGCFVVGVSPNRVVNTLVVKMWCHRHKCLGGIIGRTGRIGGLLDEVSDAARFIGVYAAERRRFGARHPDSRQPWLPPLGRATSPSAGIHPLRDRREDHQMVRIVVDQVERLVDGIGRSGVPAGAEPLLRKHRGDVFAGNPSAASSARCGGPADHDLYWVRTQIRRYLRIDQVRQHEVDQPVRAARGTAGFARSLPSADTGACPHRLPARCPTWGCSSCCKPKRQEAATARDCQTPRITPTRALLLRRRGTPLRSALCEVAMMTQEYPARCTAVPGSRHRTHGATASAVRCRRALHGRIGRAGF